MRPVHRFALAAAALTAARQLTPDALGAQPASIPQRTTAPPVAVSAESFTTINGIRELSSGAVLVNEVGRRRLVKLDSALRLTRVLADTSGQSAQPYGPRATAMLPFTGDSTLLLDVEGRALLVFDSSGTVQRVMALPRPDDAAALATANSSTAGFDARGRLLYRVSLMPAFRPPIRGRAYTPPAVADSAPILRVDLDTRRADTVTWIRTPRMKIQAEQLANGGVRLTPVLVPISTIDDWALAPQGEVVVVRGSDYHIDRFASDGAPQQFAKLPFAWRRLTDDDKTAIVDSARSALERQAAEAATRAAGGNGAGATPGGHGAAGSAAGHSMTIMPLGESSDRPAPQSASQTPSPIASSSVVPASELPDYVPPVFRAGVTRVDPAGQVWVLPSTSSAAGDGLLYDVVDSTGTLRERVRLPAGRVLEGFGRDGALYLAAFGSGGMRLERTAVRRDP